MHDDQLTFRRGTTAAVAGLVIQVALTVAMGIVGLWTESPAVQAATWHFLAGLPIWIILALVYNQYEAERRETLASERLATQDAASSVLFGDLSDELQRARQHPPPLPPSCVRGGAPLQRPFTRGPRAPSAASPRDGRRRLPLPRNRLRL